LSNQVHLFVCCLRVEFLLKTDSGYPKDTGVNNNLFPNHFQVCCGHHNKKTARSAIFFLGQCPVNTVMHTESEACQKQC